jgi:hypothetical protein
MWSRTSAVGGNTGYMRPAHLKALFKGLVTASHPLRFATSSDSIEMPTENQCCGNGCEDCVWVQYWEQISKAELEKKKASEANDLHKDNIQRVNAHVEEKIGQKPLSQPPNEPAGVKKEG